MENKNYYDWLEISPKASPEVVEKAYKALVKKYHPDLQEGDKTEAEEIIKKINEAYDVLSNSEKRAEYDAHLQIDNVSKEDYERLKQELNNVKQNQSNESQNYTNSYSPQQFSSNEPSPDELNYQRQMELERQRQQDIEYQRQVEAARQKAYHDAYVQDLRNRGYKIRYKKSFKDYIRIAITIVVIIFIFWITWHIPFIHNWLVSLYNSNEIIRLLVDAFKNIYDSFAVTFKN